MTEASNDQEFVTIAEAARRLGISERQAHRDAKKLSDNDRRAADTGPQRVRLVAMAGLRGQQITPETTADIGADVSDNGSQRVRRTADTLADAPAAPPDASGALIDQLRTENEYLRAALTREQETARAALSELSAFRQQAAVMIAATATGQIASAGQGQNTPQEAPQGDSTGDRAEGGHSQTPGAAEGKKRGFFARFFGGRKEEA